MAGFCSISYAREAAQRVVAGAVCVLLAGQPMFGAGVPEGSGGTGARRKQVRTVEIQGQARVLHALNRLTFGPRPGEVEAVEKMGLNKWFDLQLNPEKIDDSALEARLQQYPAMQMRTAELAQHYPGPQAIKAMEEGKLALPSDPTERAIATDEIAFYRMQKAKQAEKTEAGTEVQKAASPAGTGMAEGSSAARPMASGDTPVGDTELAEGQGWDKKTRRKQVNAGLSALNEAGGEMGMTSAGAGGMTPSGVTVGPFPREKALAILNQAPQQRMETMLGMPAAELQSFRQSLKGPEAARVMDGLTPVQKETLEALPGAPRMIAAEAMETRVLRDVYSERQLEAVMTDFWLNHFNVYMRKNQIEPYLIPSYERDTIRPHALGRFEDLLVATAKSPAMLVYLDNWQSIGPDSLAATRTRQVQKMRPNGKLAKAASAGLNENYGRELMELQTLGVNGGYTQADVTQVSKVFTGWTVDRPYAMGDEGGGGFVFNERRHEPGPKVVLGKTIQENGEKEGLEVLHMLATSPATAHFISQKLAVRFVSDTPPPALVERMAQSFLKSDGDIKTVLRTMFDSPEFWSPAVVEAKVKTPEEFVFSAVRASGAEVKNPLAVVQSLDRLGMPLYGMQTPNGYSWMKDEWVSTGALVSRMNFALVMSAGRLPGTKTEWSELLGESPAGGAKQASFETSAGGNEAKADDAAKEEKLEQILLGKPVSERTRQTVLAQAENGKVAGQAAAEFDLRGTGGGKQAAKYPKVLENGLRRQGANANQDDRTAAVMAGLLLGSPEFQRR